MVLKAKILIAVLLFISNSAIGQGVSPGQLDSIVTDFVKEIQSKNIDTICIYKDYCVGCVYSIFDEEKRCNYSSIYIPTYILWIKKGKTFLTKKDNCFNYSTIEIDAANLWRLFFRHQKQIKREKVKMFEYIVYENQKKTVYFIMRDHSNHQDFKMIINGDIISMNFDEFDLEKKCDGSVNINYLYNQKLKGKKIIDELNQLTRNIEKEKLFVIDRILLLE
jgi:hypothetical protein